MHAVDQAETQDGEIVKRPVVTFVSGVLATVLLVALLAGAAWWGGQNAGAQDEGTWQVKVFDGNYVLNGGALKADPDAFIDDWVAELPVECDFQILQDAAYVFYRCP